MSEAGSSALAKSIYQAFANYKSRHDSPSARSVEPSPTLPKESTPDKPAPITEKKAPAPAPKKSNTSKAKPVFKIQILASDKKLSNQSKQFKGLSPVGYYQEKGLYKYTYGDNTDYNKVLRTKKQIASKFKGAFIVAFKNGKKMDVNQAIKEFKNNNK